MKLGDNGLIILRHTFSIFSPDASQPFATEDFLKEIATETVKLTVVLNALINVALCNMIFDKPFGHLGLSSTLDSDHDTEATLIMLMHRAARSRSTPFILE